MPGEDKKILSVYETNADKTIIVLDWSNHSVDWSTVNINFNKICSDGSKNMEHTKMIIRGNEYSSTLNIKTDKVDIRSNISPLTVNSMTLGNGLYVNHNISIETLRVKENSKVIIKEDVKTIKTLIVPNQNYICWTAPDNSEIYIADECIPPKFFIKSPVHISRMEAYHPEKSCYIKSFFSHLPHISTRQSLNKIDVQVNFIEKYHARNFEKDEFLLEQPIDENGLTLFSSPQHKSKEIIGYIGLGDPKLSRCVRLITATRTYWKKGEESSTYSYMKLNLKLEKNSDYQGVKTGVRLTYFSGFTKPVEINLAHYMK